MIPRDAKRIEKKAASDLRPVPQADLRRRLPGRQRGRSSPAGGGPYISVGRTELLAESRCQWKNADLAAEGYALEVVGENVYLYGGSGRGLMHGVYSLLEEDLGCRWYSTDSVDTPQMTRARREPGAAQVRAGAGTARPVHPTRCTTPTGRCGTRPTRPTPESRWPGAAASATTTWGTPMAAYFPTEQYFAEHPEYYALVNGKRQPSQLCHTNEDVIRLSIEKTCEIFRNHPEVTITAIGPNDGRGFCDCPNCKKLDDENGGRSGSFFYIVNRIAEGVKKEFPNNHLISLAYLDYAQPPTKLKVDDYVIIQLCTDSHAWKYQFCFVWESEQFQADASRPGTRSRPRSSSGTTRPTTSTTWCRWRTGRWWRRTPGSTSATAQPGSCTSPS